jgi:O-antigen/teichoic acid export membrane protein
VRRRALSGSAAVVFRGLAIRSFGFLGSLVLARLLTPSDFGLVAFGSALLVAASFFSAGGLGSALIRRPDPPTRLELEALLGLQLVATLAMAVGTTAVAIAFFGRSGQIVSLMTFSLPLLVMRAPGAILLERELSYRPLVAVEVAESLAFYVFAVATVAAGLGVWGFASAYIVRSAVGSALLLRVVKPRVARPRLSIDAVRGLLAFGLRFQAPGILEIGYQQALNSGAVAIAGTATLGLFTLGKAIWSVPGLIFSSLSRVSFPAMSRLSEAGEELAAVVERTIARLSVLTGILYVGLVGVAPPLVTVLFGERWAGTADVIPWVSLSVVIAGPISVACAGYLYAIGDAATVLRSAIATTIADLGTTFALLSSLGVTAFGIGRIAGSVADVLVLGRTAGKSAGASVFGPLAVPGALSVAAGAAAWLVGAAIDPAVPAALAGVAVGEGLLLAALWLTRKPLLLDTAGTLRRAVSTARESLGPSPSE